MSPSSPFITTNSYYLSHFTVSSRHLCNGTQKKDGLLCDDLGSSSHGYDPCFCVNSSKDALVLIELYVDDLLLTAMQLKTLLTLKDDLSQRFGMEDCGEAKLCSGLESTRWRNDRELKNMSVFVCEQSLKRF